MATDLVRGRNLTLGYHGHVVLDKLDFTIERGDFLGVMGPNGSGKTTLIKAILGLVPPLRGAIEFPGRDGEPPRFGYVPQRERLDIHFPLSSLEVAVMGRYGLIPTMRAASGRDFDMARSCLKRVRMADRVGSGPVPAWMARVTKRWLIGGGTATAAADGSADPCG
jgi:ABC-type Mn2+/Zn2+ transport system ATPase subunit